jgi:DNA-directed RNA polymerase subunit RPC12/RpoP
VSDPHAIEFICIDCGTRVFAIGYHHANDDPVCATCSWLRAIEDPDEREKLRKFLNRD